jgi:hypothetical protein
MARTIRTDYGDRAYERVCAKLDRESPPCNPSFRGTTVTTPTQVVNKRASNFSGSTATSSHSAGLERRLRRSHPRLAAAASMSFGLFRSCLAISSSYRWVLLSYLGPWAIGIDNAERRIPIVAPIEGRSSMKGQQAARSAVSHQPHGSRPDHPPGLERVKTYERPQQRSDRKTSS